MNEQFETQWLDSLACVFFHVPSLSLPSNEMNKWMFEVKSLVCYYFLSYCTFLYLVSSLSPSNLLYEVNLSNLPPLPLSFTQKQSHSLNPSSSPVNNYQTLHFLDLLHYHWSALRYITSFLKHYCSRYSLTDVDVMFSVGGDVVDSFK